MLNQEQEYYFKKAISYDVFSQYYKYSNPDLHTKYYYNHLKYLQLALQTFYNKDKKYHYVHTRFINLLNFEIDVFLNDTKILKNIPPNGISEYFIVPTATYQLELRSTNLADKSIQKQTFEIIGIDFSTFVILEKKVLFFPTEQFIPENETKLRIIHLSEQTPTIDVRVTHGDIVFPNVSYGVATNYLDLSPMTLDLFLSVSNCKETLFSLPKLKLYANEIYSLMIISDVTKPNGINTLLIKD